MKSRIAIFSGYGNPFGRPSGGSYGRSYGRPIGRISGGAYGRRAMGRRAYTVDAAYPPDRPHVAYKVKKKRNTPAMKRAMNRFKKAAKSCSRKTKNSRKGAFQRCMKVALKKGRKSKR